MKICATTTLEDAKLALEAGADAVGFVFARSPRQVTVDQVKSITAHLPAALETVGVFAGGDPGEVAEAAVEAGLTAIQMHGGLDLEWAGRLRARAGQSLALIHTLSWQVGEDDAAERVVRSQLRELSAAGLGERVLLDAKVGAATGGLGVRFDWLRARLVLEEAAQGLQMIIAGGLRPENVEEAVRTLSPYGVDVASGVERVAATKDPEKVRAFVKNARRA